MHGHVRLDGVLMSSMGGAIASLYLIEDCSPPCSLIGLACLLVLARRLWTYYRSPPPPPPDFGRRRGDRSAFLTCIHTCIGGPWLELVT